MDFVEAGDEDRQSEREEDGGGLSPVPPDVNGTIPEKGEDGVLRDVHPRPQTSVQEMEDGGISRGEDPAQQRHEHPGGVFARETFC
jgi:hypothetical protein